MLFDWRVVAFAVGLGLVVVVVGGLWPARRVVRRSMAWGSRTGAGLTMAVPARASRLILVSELAVATVVMVGTLFIGLGIWRYLHQPLGFQFEGRLWVDVELSEPRRLTVAETESALAALRTIPGVRAASAYQTASDPKVEVPGLSLDPKSVGATLVPREFFEAWGMRVRAGRWFTADEFSRNEPVAVADTKFAALAWAGADPIGREVRVQGVPRTIIGVVDHRRGSLSRESAGQVLVPAQQPRAVGLVAWAPGASPLELQARLAAALAGVMPVSRVGADPVTLETLFRREIGEARFQAPIMIAFGALAFVLAGIGVFGLVSYLVEQRTREFGIRIALGARPGRVWRSVVRESVGPAAVGLVAGAGVAWALESVVRSAVFGWQSSGIAAVAVVAVALLGVAVCAAALPARRAMRIDPALTLKAE
jgi:hypothetical protein